MTKITCIYQIRNLVTGRVYIGQAVDFYKRKENHLGKLRYSKHYNKELQADFTQLGASNFKFEILEEVPLLELSLMEEIWIAVLDAQKPTYNIVKTMGSKNNG